MYATFSPVDASEQIWCQDSAAASHMIPDDGKLLSKSPYSGKVLLRLGMEFCCQLSVLVIALFQLL